MIIETHVLVCIQIPLLCRYLIWKYCHQLLWKWNGKNMDWNGRNIHLLFTTVYFEFCLFIMNILDLYNNKRSTIVPSKVFLQCDESTVESRFIFYDFQMSSNENKLNKFLWWNILINYSMVLKDKRIKFNQVNKPWNIFRCYEDAKWICVCEIRFAFTGIANTECSKQIRQQKRKLTFPDLFFMPIKVKSQDTFTNHNLHSIKMPKFMILSIFISKIKIWWKYQTMFAWDGLHVLQNWNEKFNLYFDCSPSFSSLFGFFWLPSGCVLVSPVPEWVGFDLSAWFPEPKFRFLWLRSDSGIYVVDLRAVCFRCSIFIFL